MHTQNGCRGLTAAGTERRLGQLAKRRRALLESNPPRNSRPPTHRAEAARGRQAPGGSTSDGIAPVGNISVSQFGGAFQHSGYSFLWNLGSQVIEGTGDRFPHRRWVSRGTNKRWRGKGWIGMRHSRPPTNRAEAARGRQAPSGSPSDGIAPVGNFSVPQFGGARQAARYSFLWNLGSQVLEGTGDRFPHRRSCLGHKQQLCSKRWIGMWGVACCKAASVTLPGCYSGAALARGRSAGRRGGRGRGNPTAVCAGS